ncbi:MAG: phosphate signaling complex protein PhoU [Peptococcaceae bacterium]|nr:phosphate signaling complex protein PhoU [Peptococcaceae bacterium]
MRDLFVGQLERLTYEISEMGGICEEAIQKGSEALLKGDAELAQNTLKYTALLDDKEYLIDALCSSLIMQQQPVAGDFRIISTASKIVGDLARIGMQAVDISEIVLRNNNCNKDMDIEYFADLAKATRRMLRDVLNAYEAKDLELARDVVSYDDVVDEYFHKTKNNLAEMLKNAKSTQDTDYVLDLLMVDKYYERIGDHIVKIAEAVEYGITSQNVKASK